MSRQFVLSSSPCCRRLWSSRRSPPRRRRARRTSSKHEAVGCRWPARPSTTPLRGAAAQNRIINYVNDMIDQTPSRSDHSHHAVQPHVRVDRREDHSCLQAGRERPDRGQRPGPGQRRQPTRPVPAAAKAARDQHDEAQLLRRLQARLPHGQGRGAAHQVRHDHQGARPGTARARNLVFTASGNITCGWATGSPVQRPVRHRRTPRPLRSFNQIFAQLAADKRAARLPSAGTRAAPTRPGSSRARAPTRFNDPMWQALQVGQVPRRAEHGPAGGRSCRSRCSPGTATAA